MTIGIYALYWESEDLVYVGQSQDIDSRFAEHLYKLRTNKHSNYRVQNTYNLYGIPELVILEECSLAELNNLEVYWTKELNALDPTVGLCLVEPGTVGFGTHSNASKYSRTQVLKTFSLLYKGVLSISSILDRTGVKTQTINDILKGRSHLWLREAYPVQYLKMLNRQKVYNTISKSLKNVPVLISPEGTRVEIQSITDFCKSLNTNTALPSVVRGFARVIDGTRLQYKGWKLEK